jgi:hypothetical protein
VAETEQKHPAGTPGVWKAPNFKGIMLGVAAFVLIMLILVAVVVKKEGVHLMLGTRPTHANQN